MDKQEILKMAYFTLRQRGKVHTQTDFARLLDVNRSNLSRALNGDPRYLTDNLITKAQNALDGKTLIPAQWVEEFPSLDPDEDRTPEPEVIAPETVPILPVEAVAGTIGEFVSGPIDNCDRMISPIKGAELAIKVCGDSMSPEYPNGCLALIRRVNEQAYIEWGKVYVLDTDNGVLIKKVRRTDDYNIIECFSVNPEYQSFTINKDYIHGWYRILCVVDIK